MQLDRYRSGTKVQRSKIEGESENISTPSRVFCLHYDNLISCSLNDTQVSANDNIRRKDIFGRHKRRKTWLDGCN